MSDESGLVYDLFGVPGVDGTGTAHEFEDGRAERADNTSASATWDEAGWNIDNDSGGGDGNQYAPEGFDSGEWIGASSDNDGGTEIVQGCLDPNASNYDSSANEQSYNEFGTSTCTYESCSDIPTTTGCLWEDGTSGEWWEGVAELY